MAKKWTGERLETFVFNETMIEHLHRYAIALEFTQGKTVLDIACGEGYGSNLLAKVSKDVTAVDIDETTIVAANGKYKAGNLHFITGRVEEIPLGDKQFDVVVCFETLEHTSQHVRMMEEIKRVLKPDGILILSTPERKDHRKDLYINPFHEKEVSKEELTSLLGTHFTNIQYCYQTLTLASVLISNSRESLKMYNGDYDSIKQTTSVCDGYFVAIASDHEVKALPPSIFFGNHIWEKLLLDRELLVKRTVSYKLGHFILLPFKWIRKIAKRG